MSDTTTLNENVAHCLKSMEHFGFSRVHNLCTGTFTDVPFGVIDWLMYGALFESLVAMTIFLLGMAAVMIRDTF